MNLISELIILLSLGIAGGIAAKLLKLPPVVGYILGGVLFSFFFKPADSSTITGLSQIGITLLLFSIGIDFSLDRLLKVKKYVLIGGGLQIILTIIFSVFLFPVFGFSQYESLFLGSIFALSSTAVVVKLMEEKGELDSFAGQITLGWLVVQDIAVVIIIIFLSSFASKEFNATALFESLFKSLILIMLALVVGRKVIPRILVSLAKYGTRDILIVSAFAFALFFAFLSEQFGISSTLGAFLAGLMISESVYTHEIITEIKPLQTIFSMLFFITIGTLLSLQFLTAHIITLVLIGILGMLLKSLIVFGINYFFKINLKTNLAIVLYLAQIGEFAFLISQIAFSSKWISADFSNTVLSLTIMSLVVSPLVINNQEKIYDKLTNFLKRKAPLVYRKVFNKSTVESFSVEELSNHIVVCGYGKVGKYVTQGLDKMNERYLVIDINDTAITGDKPDNFIIGDAVNRDILLAAKLEKAKVCIITMPHDSDINEIIRLCMEINPDIKIITRVHNAIIEENLENIHAIIEPEFETGLKMIEKILQVFNKRDKKVLNYLRDIKAH
jgi:CPA2 family monovalent cation:H+ antiporter-2